MSQRIDYLGALVPRTVGASAPRPVETDLFGIAALALLAKGAARGVQALRSEQGQRMISDLKKRAFDDENRFKLLWIRYRNKAAKSTTPKERQKWLKKSINYQERFELARARQLFADRGIGGRDPTAQGTIKEYRRNVLTAEWDGASTERKKQIEGLIGAYDVALSTLKREADVLKQSGFGALHRRSPSARGSRALHRRSPSARGSRARDFPLTPDQALVQGLGGLTFDVQSPSGPGRLCRLPLYPVSDADAMSGVTGIITPGDDPVLLMQLTPIGPGGTSVFVLGPQYELTTRTLEYGTYRIVGIQCAIQNNYVAKDQANLFASSATSILGVAVTVRSLRVYNGAEVLLPLNDLDARSFDLFRSDSHPGVSPGPAAGFTQQSPYSWGQRLGSLFMGLRDYPVIESDATAQMKVQAFASDVAENFTLPVPVTFNLVCEILTDKVYGDPINPSPAGRAGALVKLGAEEVVSPMDETTRYRLTSARWRRPS